jgi:hypothetical protein
MISPSANAWRDYMKAYEIALARCSTASAPWFIVPADRKWYRNAVIARITRLTLGALDLAYPCEMPNIDRLQNKLPLKGEGNDRSGRGYDYHNWK